MRERPVAIVIASTVGIGSLVGLLSKLFAWIGWIEWAQGLGAVMALFHNPNISWAGIYVFAAIGAACTLAVINFDILQSWHARQVASRTRHWDMTLCAVTKFIADHSLLGQSLTGGQKYSDAFIALQEAARAGRFALAGKIPGSQKLVPIPDRLVRECRFTTLPLGDRTWAVHLIEDLDDGALVFCDLFADSRQIHAVWPSGEGWVSLGAEG